MKKRSRTSDCTKEKYLLAFLLGFGTMLFTVLPMMVSERGYFIYYGDYNAQQIPFYSLANDAVRSGSPGWNRALIHLFIRTSFDKLCAASPRVFTIDSGVFPLTVRKASDKGPVMIGRKNR